MVWKRTTIATITIPTIFGPSLLRGANGLCVTLAVVVALVIALLLRFFSCCFSFMYFANNMGLQSQFGCILRCIPSVYNNNILKSTYTSNIFQRVILEYIELESFRILQKYQLIYKLLFQNNQV